MQRRWLSSLLGRIAVTAACLAVSRVLLQVPLPIADQAMRTSELQRNSISGPTGLIAGAPLRNISVGGLGLEPFLAAFAIVWMLRLLSPALRSRWDADGRRYADLSWLTAILAMLAAFGRVRFETSGHPRLITSLPGLVSMALLVLGTMILFWLGRALDRWGWPSGQGVFFLLAVSLLLGGVHSLARVLAEQPLTARWLLVLGAYGILNVLLLLSAVSVILGFRLIHLADRIGQRAPARQSELIYLFNAGVWMPAVVASGLVGLPNAIGGMAGLRDAAVERFWSSNGPSLWLDILYNVTFIVLVVAVAAAAGWMNYSGKYVVRRAHRKGWIVPAAPGWRPADYLDRVAMSLSLAGGVWLALVVVAIPSLFSLTFGSSGLNLGGLSWVIVAATLVNLAHRTLMEA